MIIYKLKFFADNHMTLQIISFIVWQVTIFICGINGISTIYFILSSLVFFLVVASLHYIWYKNFNMELIIKKLKSK